MNQWPNGSANAMFPPNAPGHLNPAAIYNNNLGGGSAFDVNQFTQGLSNGHSASPTPSYPGQQPQPQPQQAQSFQPGSIIPAKRPHDGMSASPVQPQASRSQTPNFAAFPGPQNSGQPFPNAPTPFQHLQQSGSNNATPSPTMQSQQFRPPNQQQQPQQQQSRMQNTSPSPFPQQGNFGNQMSPGGPHAQNPMNMMQQNNMGGFNSQFAMNNMSMSGMASSMAPQMNNMAAAGGALPNSVQQAYQAKLLLHQQALRASGMMPQRGAMVGQQQQQQQPSQQQQQQSHQQQQSPPQQNPMFNPNAPGQMGGQMANGQAGMSMHLNQQKMQSQQLQQQQKRAQFLKTIAAHAAQQGRQINLNPTINGRPVDLYILWYTLTGFGGSANVEKTGQWPAVAAKLRFPPAQNPNAGEELKQLHATTIAQYERLWFAVRTQQKQEQARMHASQMALGAPAQGSPTRMQPPNQQNPYAQFQHSQPPQQQPSATPVQANAQLPQNGMSTPQQQMMQPRRQSSVRKVDQMTPQPPGASAVIAASPHSASKAMQVSPAADLIAGVVMKSEESQSTNYIPSTRAIESDGGYDVSALFDLGNTISRTMPNMPTLEEMGVIDLKAITLSLASGIHSEVRYALDVLALITNDHRIKPELEKCQDLIYVIVDCAEDQIEILSEDATEASDALDLASYEDVMRAGRIEAETLQDVPEVGTPAYDLERAAERLIAVSTILRNCSFFEENHKLLTSTPLIKWLSNTIRLLGTRNKLLRSYHNAQDFYKDMITFLSNVTQSLEIPSKDDALHILHFLLAFAPQPAPRYTNSGGVVRFATFVPAIHKYLPPAVDCLAKLLARQDPNRMFYKSIFTSSATSFTGLESPLDLLTRAFALSISVLPDRSRGPLPNSQQLRIVEARKAYLTQGMLAADILSSLAPHNDNDLARAWLESEDGWAVGLLSLVPLLSVDRNLQQQQQPISGGAKSRELSYDTESSKLITWRALTMTKRLAEKAGKINTSSPVSAPSKRFAITAASAGVTTDASQVNGQSETLSSAATNGITTEQGLNSNSERRDPAGNEQEKGTSNDKRPTLRRRNMSSTAPSIGPPKWEGMPQGHSIVGALMMPSTDKVALGLLCGLHEMAMSN